VVATVDLVVARVVDVTFWLVSVVVVVAPGVVVVVVAPVEIANVTVEPAGTATGFVDPS
jgi:hypothetical protein